MTSITEIAQQATKYFQTTKKGEVHDLQQDLLSPKEATRKDAVKRVIAAMTVGKDVAPLFTDVLNCIQTQNLELKKLVYLYVINHAKLQPDKAILAVNSFQRDSGDTNPLIRALAIRTMGMIRVDKVVEYLCEPLRNCLKDKDPYVRKTAAICVAKLYDSNPELVESQGFLDMLINLLSDSNPTVVANAVAALSEIDEHSKKSVFEINAGNLNKLQIALGECTEWGQVFILNALSKYKPTDSKDAENLCDRVVPRLNHANSAVVLAAVKVLMVCLEHIQIEEKVKELCRKMAPPLVTLLTTKEPEIQYVALRNINLIVQRRPQILANELRVFYIKYNDPIYVKMEKLEIMIMLASDKNIEQLLNEFKEAASEVDVEFVRKAVRAIGRCAIKIDVAAERCIQVLLDLIQTQINYVVQEAIVVIKDIFRKYPNKYESIIGTLCENLQSLDEPDAKASMIWIIGEYADRIDNANVLLESFLENFSDESATVQLQLLTAIVKLFLKKPKNAQEMVQKVLNLATQETDNPDLRDRGYVYWRLLSADPEAAKSVVLGEKPLISDSSSKLDEKLLQTLISNISSLSAVYHKPPETFVAKLKDLKKEKQEDVEEEKVGDLLLDDLSSTSPQVPQKNNNSGNLLDMSPSTPANNVGSLLDDILGGPSPAPSNNQASQANRPILLQAQQGQGMVISGAFERKGDNVVFEMKFTNQSMVALSGFAIQFDKNIFCFAPAPLPLGSLPPGQSQNVSLPVAVAPAMELPSGSQISNIVRVAVRNSVGIYYFQADVPFYVGFKPTGKFGKEDYINYWKSISEEHFSEISGISTDSSVLQKKLEARNLIYMATRKVQNLDFLYFYANFCKNDIPILLELAVTQAGVKACTKTRNPEFIPLFQKTIAEILKS